MDKPETSTLGQRLASCTLKGRLKRARLLRSEQKMLPTHMAAAWDEAKRDAEKQCLQAVEHYKWVYSVYPCKFQVFEPTGKDIFNALPDEVREMAECQHEDYDVIICTTPSKQIFNIELVFRKAIDALEREWEGQGGVVPLNESLLDEMYRYDKWVEARREPPAATPPVPEEESASPPANLVGHVVSWDEGHDGPEPSAEVLTDDGQGNLAVDASAHCDGSLQ